MEPNSLDDVSAFTGDEEIVKIYNYDDLQRTEEWFKERGECYTGSVNSQLMGCGKATSKLPWSDVAKLFDFGQTAKKMIYRVGWQRKTKLLDMSVTSKRMSWGIENEAAFIERLLKDGIITDYKKLGFEKFYEFGGASIDGIARVGPNCNVKGLTVGEWVNLELKCTTSWAGHFMRCYEKVDENHNDFWQHQSEMMATKHKKLLFAVARPITIEQYDLDAVMYSELHAKVLLSRCKISDLAISLWDKFGYEEALSIACSEFGYIKPAKKVKEKTIKKIDPIVESGDSMPIEAIEPIIKKEGEDPW